MKKILIELLKRQAIHSNKLGRMRAITGLEYHELGLYSYDLILDLLGFKEETYQQGELRDKMQDAFMQIWDVKEELNEAWLHPSITGHIEGLMEIAKDFDMPFIEIIQSKYPRIAFANASISKTKML